MIEYAILIVMVVFATCFVWLWVIEQRKRQKRKMLPQRKTEPMLFGSAGTKFGLRA